MTSLGMETGPGSDLKIAHSQPSEADISRVREDLLAHNHELVKSSEFRANLGQIQQFLDEAEEMPEELGPIASALTEREMDRAIIKERDEFSGSATETWANQTSWCSRWLLGFWPLAFFGFLAFVVHPAFMVTAVFITIPTSVSMLDGTDYPEVFRNKVLRRKAYRREVHRLLCLAEDKRARYERLKNLRQAKIAAAQKALEPMAKDFSIAHPGKTLAITNENTAPTITVAEDSSYTELDRIAALMITEERD